MDDTTTLEEAMVEYFNADSIDEIRWANGDYEDHGRYLVARWLGMNKQHAYRWTKE